MKSNLYVNSSCIGFTLLVLILSGCGTTSNAELFAHSRFDSRPEKVHTIAIVNTSKAIITTIKFKPCGSPEGKYHFLTQNLRPREKLTVNLYSPCVDLLAINAFKKKLVDVRNVNLNTIKTWTIK